MTSPETRRTEIRTIHIYGHGHETDLDIDQQAIPWCTTHYGIVVNSTPERQCWRAFWLGGEFNEEPCNISSGGPDHKWWRDP